MPDDIMEASARADRDAALAAATVASEFAQSAIKAGFLLNGGGLIAIPAIVALFKLDAEKGFWPLFATGGTFVLGLVVTWSASLCGYLAFWQLREWHIARAVMFDRILEFHSAPSGGEEKELRAVDAAERQMRRMRNSKRWRYAVAVLCLVALLVFVAGVSIGAHAVADLAIKIERSLPLSPAAQPPATRPETR
jgi:hypothetical protein